MPIYEYRCTACTQVSEFQHKINDPAPKDCPKCEKPGTLSKIMSATSFVLKGSGWFSDAYSSKKPQSNKSNSESTTSSSTETKAPAPTSDTPKT